jgi:hypothetical protein
MRVTLIAIAITLLCAGAEAQDRIYKVRTPDGRILFTDTPPPGARIESEREVPPPTPPAPVQPDREEQLRSLQQQAAKAGERQRDRSAQLDQAFAAVQAAEAGLDTARQQLEAGREPQPGERIGTARGGTRSTPAYEQRIAGLEKAIVAAEQRLAKAREDLNALR